MKGRHLASDTPLSSFATAIDPNVLAPWAALSHVFPRNLIAKLDAVKPIPDVVSQLIVVVSLSDSNVSAPPRSEVKRASNNSHRINLSGSWSLTFSVCCMCPMEDMMGDKSVR
jgi:hypothetical protein